VIAISYDLHGTVVSNAIQTVIPAQAARYFGKGAVFEYFLLDPRLRGDDEFAAL